MRFVIQRVTRASVTIEERVAGQIRDGFLVLIGVEDSDTRELADRMISKMIHLRIFEDTAGKTNCNLASVNGSLLLVSQFTLYANASHGNRPDFLSAEAPERANELYAYVAEGLRKQGLTVKLGVFGADMKITQVNDGPFTVILEK